MRSFRRGGGAWKTGWVVTTYTVDSLCIRVCVCVCRFNHQTNWEGDAHRKWWKAKKSFLKCCVQVFGTRLFKWDVQDSSCAWKWNYSPNFFRFFLWKTNRHLPLSFKHETKNVRGMYMITRFWHRYRGDPTNTRIAKEDAISKLPERTFFFPRTNRAESDYLRYPFSLCLSLSFLPEFSYNKERKA